MYARPDRWAAGAGHWTGMVVVALAALAADQLTKYLVRNSIDLNERIDIAYPLTLWHVRNQGIAFGAFAGRIGIVAGLTVIAIVWMLWFFARSGARHAVFPGAVGLLLGGSLANLYDRLANGYVTDFIDLPWWATFNFADTFIVTGVALLMVGLFRAEPARSPRP